ncbi:aspartyl-phosphate phosphatase Spo0E family protein [Rossellomorea sp. YZS02]|uniref:aspartyl-phosphate phosphatase Spo0E family protein n=1 Tax=Rossellomorea sp. YZS02 TaxID=3097358 RepID=UPI002A0E55B1|nr:aspartyl-phosphate phosphatase Spo0E family protein [Rossellomorea sp. YZS02]MDX8342869.1 aspartyl-phosphate phosphatase Spo0E family protein [Rossellomorea sp. YZS02]
MGRLLKQKWLLMRISQKRSEMISLGGSLGLCAEETIKCSQQLDQLLNDYEKCKHNVVPFTSQESSSEFGQYIKSLLKRTAS